MSDNILKNTAVAIATEMGLQLPEGVSEEELLRLLAEKVALVVQEGQEAFYRLMYRLDINERALNRVAGTKDVAAKVARLIYERQLAKAQARRAYKQERDESDPELKW